VYISISAVTADMGSALTAGHFWQTPGMPAQPRVTTLGASPRLGMPERRPSWLTGPADQDQRHAASLALDSCYGGLCFSVGAGLPAMRTTRSFIYTELMPSPASQLLQWTVLAFDFASPHSSRPVGRCKSGTISGRYLNNGYAPQPQRRIRHPTYSPPNPIPARLLPQPSHPPGAPR
jgi:hypothetical protein